ncbi:RDD family protein [Blastopirellula sp. JC732]|uniref:RDD family protein n=1 Tax=Blastopirellula sediminis TaxID=2894196 RepID=A0A9X1MRA9_9BACT|nr:RDD family protein [Blastopirellula sediminis]MCC9604773.1 RDD family protein [Blastopirellula sediminis]MCC9631928.1 RDD family protein [Blastopirellula sediminis]
MTSDQEPINPFVSPQLDATFADADPLAVNINDLPSRTRRLLAALVDLQIVQIAAVFSTKKVLETLDYLSVRPAKASFSALNNTTELWIDRTITMAIFVSCSLFFYILFQGYTLTKSGETFGKSFFGLKIVRRDGKPASLARLVFVRYFPLLVYCSVFVYIELLVRHGFAIIALAFLFSCLLDPLFIFTKEKRCLHDYLADTIVVKA